MDVGKAGSNGHACTVLVRGGFSEMGLKYCTRAMKKVEFYTKSMRNGKSLYRTDDFKFICLVHVTVHYFTITFGLQKIDDLLLGV